MTTAVLLSVTMHPMAKAVEGFGSRMRKKMPITTTSVPRICAMPMIPPRIPNKRIFAGVISSPIVNSSRETPSSVMTSKRPVSLSPAPTSPSMARADQHASQQIPDDRADLEALEYGSDGYGADQQE